MWVYYSLGRYRYSITGILILGFESLQTLLRYLSPTLPIRTCETEQILPRHRVLREAQTVVFGSVIERKPKVDTWSPALAIRYLPPIMGHRLAYYSW